MPRSTREWAHRKLDMARGNLAGSLAHLEQIREKYQEPHPAVGEAITMVQMMIVESDDALQVIARGF